MWWADPDEKGNPNWVVVTGDCRETMNVLADNSVDSIVTDPPYELGFMGKSWDSTGIAYDPEVWRHAMRVLKPGGHLLAFSGSRTYHRMACAIEDAGFEIRDQIMWLYGSGFPKSHDVSKAIDREAGAEREVLGEVSGGGRLAGDNYQSSVMGGGWHGVKITEPATSDAEKWSGWGTALKPAHEPIVLARKPFKGTVAQNVLAHGTGALNIDGCRVNGEPSGRWPANVTHDGSDEVVKGFPANVKGVYGAKAIGKVQFMDNHDQSGGSIGSGNGITDTGSAARFFYCPKASKHDREEGLDQLEDRILNRTNPGGIENDPKWAPRVRKNNHPTVKPTELMRYLCRLITPPGGIVLDPFAGSGSTGKAAVLEGFGFIGCEMDEDYAKIARSRIRFAENQD